MSLAPASAIAIEPAPVQAPQVQTPAPQTSAPQTPAPQTPTVQTPKVQTPTVQTPASPAPDERSPTPPAPAPEPTAESPSSASPLVVAEAPADQPAAYGVMIEEGQALIAQGRPAEGAGRLSDAYVAMPAALRVGDGGRDVVVQASGAFQMAAEADPALLDAEQALLTAYFADLGEARAAGRPTSVGDEREDALGQRLAEVEQALAQREGVPGSDEVGPIDALGPAAPPDPRRRLVTRLLLGAGAVGAIGGGVMVAVGAVAASRAEEQRPLAGPEEQGQIRQAKLAGTLMASFGALIFSGSVMMLGVGTNRLGDRSEGRRISVAPTRRGIAVSGRF